MRVVDLTHDHPGAIVAMFLADYGAEVIKIAQHAAEDAPRTESFRVWDRGKRLWLGETRPPNVARLMTTADIAVESSMTVGADDRLWGSYEDHAASNERLIWLSITPYGPDGPLSGQCGYEGTVAAASGIMTEQRTADGAPFWNALPLAGYGTALLGILGVLSALHSREVTGKGQRVWTSMYQGALAARSPMLVEGEGVQTWDSAGNDPQGALPNYRLYQAADGKWIHIGALIPDFWNKLAISADLLELVTDPRFETAPLYWPDEETRAAAKRIIGERIAQKPRDEWLEVLLEGDVPVAPASWAHELIDDPQVAANGLQTTVADADGRASEQVAPPIRLWASPGAARASEIIANASPLRWISTPRPSIGEAPAADAMFRGPLSGVRVLDLSSYLAGPIGPAYLADLGADVIKVEPPAGEGCRMIMMLYLGGNTGKRDLALDIRRPESREVLERLIRASDIVVHNNRVGVAERLGIDYESVRAIRPDVIYLHSTAFGSEGPDAERPGFDPLAQSLTGISHAHGGPGRPPVFPKTPICDIATAMLGAAGALLGLVHRNRTGQGQRIETSLLATGLWLKSDSFVHPEGWQPPHETNGDNSGLDAAYRAYRASDRYVFVGARTPSERRAFAEMAGLPELPETVGGTDADEALARRVADLTARSTAAEWVARLGDAGVPAEIVAEDHEEGVYANPQAAYLGAIARAGYPGFTNLRQPGMLIGFSATPGERRSGSPVCGQHTEEVLRQFGFSGDEIAALEESGTVAVYREESIPR